MSLRIAALMTIAVLITACSTHTKIDGALGLNSFPLSQPSSRILAAAANKPKDRHSMPVYDYGDRKRLVRTTAYTCTEWDHLRYGSKSASGNRLLFGKKVRSAAADWSFYPLGTTFRIKGMNQLFVIDDYGSALTGTGTIDLYKPNKGEMNKWGRRNVEIQVVEWGSFERSAHMLRDRTRHWHCRAMLDNILRQQPKLKQTIRR